MLRSLLLLVLAAPLCAEECVCPASTSQEQFETATMVFRGPLSEIQESKKAPRAYVFDVNDIFKGDAKDDMHFEDAEEGTVCALMLETGREYIVYGRWQWGRLLTSRCWGTKPIGQANAERDVLGPGNEWKSRLYPKLREACMGTYDTPCCLSSVKAMEQGHYLPEPDDGCPEGMRPDVLRCKGSLRWCEPIMGTPASHQP